MNYISRIVQKLIMEYKSRDPFVIAEKLGITVLFKSYKYIRGYYTKITEKQFIVINANLSYTEQLYVAAHELAHACLHKEYSILFIEEQTLFPINYYNSEANLFAAELLIPDEIYERQDEFSIQELAELFSVPPVLVKIKLNLDLSVNTSKLRVKS